MVTLLMVVVAAGVVLFVLNRRSFYRLLNLGKVQAGAVGRWANNVDPMEQLKEEIDNGISAAEDAKKGLEEAKANIFSLKRQIANKEKDQKRLESRLSKAIESNDESQQKMLALDLAKIKNDISRNTEQLEKVENIYNNFNAQLHKHESRIQQARERSKSLGLELQMSEKEAKLAEFINSNATINSSSLTNKLAETEEKVLAQIDANRAKVEVATEFSVDLDDEEDDFETNEDAQRILDEMKNRR